MNIIILENFTAGVSVEIYRVMQESYKQEADLLGLQHFPPLDITARDIASDQGTYYGAVINERLAGVLHFNAGNIDTLVVRPCFQRLGVAANLLRRLFAEAKGTQITVSTAQLNIPATSLYKKLGFTEVSTEQKPNIQIVTFAIKL